MTPTEDTPTQYCHEITCLRKVYLPHIYCDRHEDNNSTPPKPEPSPSKGLLKLRKELDELDAAQQDDRQLRETLAEIEHDRWSDWQLWCHEVIRSNVGKINKLEDVLARWDRQAITPYAKLSDKEKASDMEQVDRYWWLIEEYVRAAQIQLVSELEGEAFYCEDEMLGAKGKVVAVSVLEHKRQELQR